MSAEQALSILYARLQQRLDIVEAELCSAKAEIEHYRFEFTNDGRDTRLMFGTRASVNYFDSIFPEAELWSFGYVERESGFAAAGKEQRVVLVLAPNRERSVSFALYEHRRNVIYMHISTGHFLCTEEQRQSLLGTLSKALLQILRQMVSAGELSREVAQSNERVVRDFCKAVLDLPMRN